VRAFYIFPRAYTRDTGIGAVVCLEHILMRHAIVACVHTRTPVAPALARSCGLDVFDAARQSSTFAHRTPVAPALARLSATLSKEAIYALRSGVHWRVR
jgi:hypothetical protein